MGDFTRAIIAFSAKTSDKMDRAARKIALDSFTSCITISPVKSGRFRGNWQPGIDAVPTGVLETLDPTGAIAIAATTEAIEGFGVGKVANLANNLPYAQRLEDGYSTQAPAGMVGLTQQRMQPIADAVIALFGRE